MYKMNALEMSVAPVVPVTAWNTLGDELGLLCRGQRDSWCATLQAVSTTVELPGDREYEQALRTLCRRTAREYGVQETVYRQGDVWLVRFSRPQVIEAARASSQAASAACQGGSLAHGCATLLRRCGVWLHD